MLGVSACCCKAWMIRKTALLYQQCLRGGRVEQHQWLNSSTANSCKDSSSDVAFEATDQTLHGTRPIARLKNWSTSQILSYSHQTYHEVRLHRWFFWLPKHRNNLAPMPPRWVKIHSSIGFRGIFHHFALAEDGEHLHPFEGDEGLLNGSWPLCHIERSTPC